MEQVFPQAAIADPMHRAAAGEMDVGDVELAVAVGADVLGVGAALEHGAAIISFAHRHAQAAGAAAATVDLVHGAQPAQSEADKHGKTNSERVIEVAPKRGQLASKPVGAGGRSRLTAHQKPAVPKTTRTNLAASHTQYLMVSNIRRRLRRWRRSGSSLIAVVGLSLAGCVVALGQSFRVESLRFGPVAVHDHLEFDYHIPIKGDPFPHEVREGYGYDGVDLELRVDWRWRGAALWTVLRGTPHSRLHFDYDQDTDFEHGTNATH